MIKSIILNSREICDLELLLDGSFSPLEGFLNENDYYSVINDMHLQSGDFFPIPITLSISKNQLNEIKDEKYILLKNDTNVIIAQLEIESIYKPDFKLESLKVFGVNLDEINHPYVKILKENEKNEKLYVGGKVIKINNIPHYDFQELRKTPKEMKDWFRVNGWENYPIIGFTCRNPLHKSHYQLMKNALDEIPNSKLFLNPVVGITQETDIDYFTRVKCYKHILKYFNENEIVLNLLNLSQRMAGPRDALFMSLIRKNYGCTHFIIGRDFSGPSYKRNDGSNFYQPYEAQELLKQYSKEIGIIPIFSKEIVYIISKTNEIDGKFICIDDITSDDKIMNISGTTLREKLRNNELIPNWFSFPEIIKELQNTNKKEGICFYLYGLSSSGKSTLANYLITKLKEITSKPITLLDGDIIRTNISKGLGFSKEDRSTNVRRIGYVASEIVKHQGIVIVANIAPFEEDRIYNRQIIEKYGNYVEIFVNTPLELCEERDTKGLYKKAKNYEIKEFTGISSPFEVSKNSEIILDGSISIDENLKKILNYVKLKNLIK